MPSKLLIATICLLFASIVYASGNDAHRRTSGLYLVEFTTGPNWAADTPPQEQTGFSDHSANLSHLRTTGVLQFGARYGDKGIVLLKLPDEAAVREALAKDPSIAAGVFKAVIHEFHPFYPGEVPASGHPPETDQ